jgi:N-acetylglucosaminyldiphosphoundecaprenol N-acetyl-beta-D-mannosaminyltransferase
MVGSLEPGKNKCTVQFVLRDKRVRTYPLRENVLGVPVDVLSWTEAIDLIFEWALRRESRTICMCNVHSIMTA